MNVCSTEIIIKKQLDLFVFMHSSCNVLADLSNGMVLIVSRGFGSVCKQHSFTKVCCRVRACVPL